MKKYIMNKTIILILTSLVMILAVSCASKTSQGDKINDKTTSVGTIEGVPEFFLTPPISQDTFYGVGSAKLKKLNASRKAALARARDDIAFQINAQVQASITDYYQESGQDDNAQTLTFIESVSRQIADTVLAGTTTEKISNSPDGTIYALISYPRANMLEAAEQSFVRNEEAAFSEFKAQEALKRLDAQISNNPTQAGSSHSNN